MTEPQTDAGREASYADWFYGGGQVSNIREAFHAGWDRSRAPLEARIAQFERIVRTLAERIAELEAAHDDARAYIGTMAPLEARIAALEGALQDIWLLTDETETMPIVDLMPGDLVERVNRLLDATPPPAPPTLDVERLREAVWNANRENAWGEAIDTTDRMADQIAREYAALAAEKPQA